MNTNGDFINSTMRLQYLLQTGKVCVNHRLYRYVMNKTPIMVVLPNVTTDCTTFNKATHQLYQFATNSTPIVPFNHDFNMDYTESPVS